MIACDTCSLASSILRGLIPLKGMLSLASTRKVLPASVFRILPQAYYWVLCVGSVLPLKASNDIQLCREQEFGSPDFPRGRRGVRTCASSRTMCLIVLLVMKV